MADISTMNVAGLAQKQYYARPADQRFEDIVALETAVKSRRDRSSEYTGNTDTFEFSHMDGDVVVVTKRDTLIPTHYSFGQSAALAGVPADFLRKLGKAGKHELVAQNLNTALAIREQKQGDMKVMAVDSLDGTSTALQALTSTGYGRIYDADVVAAVKRVLDAHPEFDNPKEWGGKRGGLYASDRDIFLFYVDGGSIVDGGADLLNGGDRDQLFRGFMVVNSEVGAAALRIITFLFRIVCGNHMIHGIEGTRVLNIRHTSGGPERFVNEVIPALTEYTQASARPIEAAVRKAKQLVLPTADDAFIKFFEVKGFTKVEIKRAKTYAEAEEGGAGSLWQMQQGFTRQARDIVFMDARTNLEKRAGKLLDLVKGD